jgi:hypothetical protein
MRATARARLKTAIAERTRALGEYELSVGTPAERAKFARLQAANLAVTVRRRTLRIARLRPGS